MLGIELEPPSLRKVRGVEDAVPPVRIVVPARAYRKTRFRSRVWSSEFGVQKHPVNDEVKLPAQRAGLPGKVISFYVVPLDPALKGGACGALAGQGRTSWRGES